MHKLLIGITLALMLAACSSTPTKEQDSAKQEDRTPSTSVTPPPKAEGPTTAPTTVAPIAADPLKDPNNILSKRSVYFDYDSNTVKDEYRPMVAAHAKYLVQERAKKIIIQGNTDERGSREYNLALGQRRADAVKQMMTILGAQGERIETVSFGEEKPRAQGTSEQAFSENRRADIVYQGE